MIRLLSAAQMRAVEQAAIGSGDVTGLELMERAGRGVVAAMFDVWPELQVAPLRAIILCGPGNNGGDGFVVARLLHVLGWEVEVFLYGEAGALPKDAKTNYDRWRTLGTVSRYVDAGEGGFAPDLSGESTLLVDALFGTGLSRPVEGLNAFGRATQAAAGRGRGARVVAIDIPSGVCADSGKRLTGGDPNREVVEIRADLTVSFHAEKLGHRLADGPRLCGKVVVKSIGLERLAKTPATATADSDNRAVRLVLRSGLGGLGKDRQTHKYAQGHALVLSGGSGRTGAARLAARGALRVGAGLVTLGVPPAAQQEIACQITALMLRRVADASALSTVLEDARLTALCLGPGLGLEDRARALVATALVSRRAVVLDADALTLIGRDPALFGALHAGCVLTPHGGEFARLFPDIAARLAALARSGPAYSKVDATREAAARAGCVVLFKGPDTVIAAPDGRCAVNAASYERAAPWLATAGSGDVLAGLIAGLLARGFDPMQAAQTAAWLHVEAARAFGPGLIAEDLPEALPTVFRSLGL
ncbi:NAD(P)H-hydrate dehydratase [Antarcticimicrobium sediminis]|uniref:Bifunctional NAD(P)H-hydrate repair enzyme n=1 Tax=Antarcticimicrobium sediminis TaxID=2546227 RepID=A0A4R5EZH3_9RHOB|nr:NAD(P)H-hydrate dehydratase [Antarcticimicrobium sediminis]TDE40270.1 NAD(P)H-hydrate dehydratase [Antarcticimicrobium sediminis]